MSDNRLFRVLAPIALAALAVGMTACGADETQSTPTVTVTQVPDEASPIEQPTETQSEPMEEASEQDGSAPVSPAQPTEELGPNDESGVVDVTVVGDQGILALQHSGTAPMGDAGPTNQKLITGPGGCLALTNEGKPRLLVFPDGATFVLQEGKPSATFGGTEHFVGRQLDVASVAVPKTDVAGIPDECMEGSDDIVVVID